jgi:hypothetical protein
MRKSNERQNAINLLSRHPDWMLNNRDSSVERDATVNTLLGLMLSAAGLTAYLAASLWYLM